MDVGHEQSVFDKIIILLRLSYELTVSRVQTCHTTLVASCSFIHVSPS